VSSSASAPTFVPFSADGHRARWVRWDGAGDEELGLVWENEGWTASGVVSAERVQYVLRLSPTWQVRQFLLFRDLPEPDLWLATDGSGRWGEMNGAHRVELDGCRDLWLDVTPFTATLPIRRLPLHVGHTADITTVHVDVETLEVRPEHQRYTRLSERRWAFSRLDPPPESPPAPAPSPPPSPLPSPEVTFEVDEHGLVLDLPGRFRRTL
jgi:hypothetical protein